MVNIVIAMWPVWLGRTVSFISAVMLRDILQIVTVSRSTVRNVLQKCDVLQSAMRQHFHISGYFFELFTRDNCGLVHNDLLTY